MDVFAAVLCAAVITKQSVSPKSIIMVKPLPKSFKCFTDSAVRLFLLFQPRRWWPSFEGAWKARNCFDVLTAKLAINDGTSNYKVQWAEIYSWASMFRICHFGFVSFFFIDQTNMDVCCRCSVIIWKAFGGVTFLFMEVALQVFINGFCLYIVSFLFFFLVWLHWCPLPFSLLLGFCSADSLLTSSSILSITFRTLNHH